MAQHHDGYLWIGTDAGLFRFDGSSFMAWDSLSDLPLPRATVTALCISRGDSLWVGFADGAGIRRIAAGQLQPPGRDAALAGSVTDIVEDGGGTVWAVADGVLYERRDSWRPVALPWDGREGRVLQAVAGPGGDLWVATRWGVFRRDDDGFRLVTSGFIWGLSEDRQGEVWTTDVAAGFTRLGTAPRDRSPHQGAGHRLMHDRAGNLWVGTFSEGLWRVPAAAKAHDSAFERADIRTGLSSDSVQTLFEDRDGNIWAGTTGGLHRFTRRQLTPVDHIGFVVTVEPGHGNRAWVSRTNGVISLSPDRDEWQRARDGSPGPDIRSLYLDARDTLWVGAAEGLYKAGAAGLTTVPLPADMPLTVRAILPAGRDALWLGDNDWLYRWDGNRLTPYDDGLPRGGRRITFAGVDRRQRLWLKFAGADLGVVDRHGRFLPAEADPEHAAAARQADVYALYQDSEGIVWFGGSNGLSRFDGHRLTAITQPHGLADDRVYAIVEDPQRRLWLNADRGLIRLARDEIGAALRDSRHRLRYRLYDAFDGLAGAALGIIRAIRTDDGTLWFVRGGGLTIVDPSRIADDTAASPAPVRIETVVANERRLAPEHGTAFPPGTARLQINYTALTLGSPNRVRFRYRLDGFDTEWVDAGARRNAFYTNLSPRSYRFVVEAQMQDGTWSASTAAWAFSIRPAVYQTGWFAAAAVGAALLAIWGIWKIRLQVMERQFALVLGERTRLSREIHDTLLQSLLGMMLQVDAISTNQAARGVRDQLLRLRRMVEAHIRDARQSIHNLRSPLLDQRDLVKALVDFGANAVADTPARFSSEVSGTPRKCPPEFESQLLRIGQEAIVNAVRHAAARTIHLAMRFDEHAIALSVTDDGRGFDYDAQADRDGDGHFGLAMMRERAEQLHSRFRIESAPGRGTRVEAVVPIGQASASWSSPS